MMWRKIRFNKKSSKQLGWIPEWFGLSDFDEELIDEILIFQGNHDLKQDGMVGVNTFRRLQLYRQLNIFDDESKILINGKKHSIGWHKVKLDLMPANCYRSVRTPRKPHVIVTHFDVCTSAESCKRVLEKRGISTHFAIDNDGTIIQLVDTNHIAWHAKSANKYAIGIDISSAYYTKYFNTYTKKGLPPRPIITDSVVHGRHLDAHLGYYPEQIQAYKVLVRYLCKVYNIPLDYPKDEKGNLSTTVDKDAAKNKFRGIVNHYNLTRNKIDTVGLKIDEIVENIKKLEREL